MNAKEFQLTLKITDQNVIIETANRNWVWVWELKSLPKEIYDITQAVLGTEIAECKKITEEVGARPEVGKA